MKRFIKLNTDNVIVGIRYGTTIVDGEIQSDVGELGQILQPDGTFITPASEQIDSSPTLEDKINYIYYKLMGVIV